MCMYAGTAKGKSKDFQKSPFKKTATQIIPIPFLYKL